jgi:hypothetical protein
LSVKRAPFAAVWTGELAGDSEDPVPRSGGQLTACLSDPAGRMCVHLADRVLVGDDPVSKQRTSRSSTVHEQSPLVVVLSLVAQMGHITHRPSSLANSAAWGPEAARRS